MEWTSSEADTREITFLYKTNCYKGNIVSSSEGNIFWTNKKDVFNYKLSLDFDKILKKFF